jgi:hypothetical protein
MTANHGSDGASPYRASLTGNILMRFSYASIKPPQ